MSAMLYRKFFFVTLLCFFCFLSFFKDFFDGFLTVFFVLELSCVFVCLLVFVLDC